jgi:hypothetical protein
MKRFIFILFFIGSQSGIAQTHEWAKAIHGVEYGNGWYGLGIESTSIDSNNNIYVTGGFTDTLFIDSISIPHTYNYPYMEAVFLAKFNKDGKIMWAKPLFAKNSDFFRLRDVKSISKNRVLIHGIFSGSVLKLTPTDSIINPNPGNDYIGFIAVYDSSGNYVKSVKIYGGKKYNASGTPMNGHLSLDQQGNFYIDFVKWRNSGSIYYKGGSIPLTDTIQKFILVKYSPEFDSVLWHKEFPPQFPFSIIRHRMGEDNNLYMACFASFGSFTLNGTSYTMKSEKGFIVVLSPGGNFIHAGIINSDSVSVGDNICDIAAKSINHIYIFGYVTDSILYQKKWYTPADKKTIGGGYAYIGLISLTNGAKWIKLNSQRGSYIAASPYTYGTRSRMNYDQTGNVHLAFSFRSNGFSIGGLSDTAVSHDKLVKFDSLGNALWLRGLPIPNTNVQDIAITTDSSMIYSGNFYQPILFKPYTLYNRKKYSYSSFLAKTVDYSITRGSVSAGPYCAGDSLVIPYKKRGIYDTSNYFVAELSDENGKFEGGERELGRVRSVKNGIVKGTLPLFKVASSGNYRIRIRSTSPVVQSYYKADTLRLLIYSRDKADPGPTETICYGDSILLNTYGGTKWTWSPKYNMDDSTKRQPIIWPTRDTTYKIIIADSSGCGAPDTAFKLINVRKPLKVSLGFYDSSLCESVLLNVPIQFIGGDSSNYNYQWYFLNSPKNWFPLKKGQNSLRDTLYYTPTDPLEKLAIILKDGCTNKLDTAYLTISQRNPVILKSQFRDTVMCSGHKLKYKATVTGGVSKYIKYQWKDLISNTILSSTDSLKIITSKTLKIQLIVNDGCEALGDTAEFEVKVKAELKALTNLRDTTICSGKSLNYTAQATGGDSKNYTYSWLLNGKEISTSNLLNLKSDILNLTSNLSLITTDNCSPNDTITKIITVLPSPKAEFTWDLACSRTVTKFKFTGTKPNSPITTQFNWNFNNEAASSIENPSHLFAKSGTSTSTLTLSSNNGCTDTVNKKIEVKVQAKADFTATDVCETDSAVFINKSQDATGYLWKFGDGQISTKTNTKHNYKISSTTTYNVTLVAQVTGGCADSVSKALTINQNPSSDFSYTYNGSKVDLKITKGGNSYQWKFGTTDSVKTTATAYSHTIKSSDQHTVCLIATDISGCSSQTCKNVTVGILKLSEKSFKIYPNPNTGNFTIEIENPGKDVSIEVYNLIGELVKKVERVGKVTLIDLDVESGIYLVKAKNGGVVWNQKVVVSRDGNSNR